MEKWALRVLHERYKIPFHSFPSVSRMPRHLSSYSTDSERGSALMEEVIAPLSKGKVDEAPPTPVS
ncbi:hypothetical protein E2C01_098580 [Portunus trituberculatus]|uniref:Uncharacterized protein n=1 Tax=Portunus trituberculatus TaxID=210409 RepID=A0A5B7K7C2_PORTR|nr:hypothetical protein [Portunus trituberculatus]